MPALIPNAFLKSLVTVGATLAMAVPAFAQTAGQEEAQVDPQVVEQEAQPPAGAPAPAVAKPLPGQVGAFEGGAIVALNMEYRSVGQVFKPASADPIGRFAFMIEIYDGTVVVTGEILEWDAAAGSGTTLWTSSELVSLENKRLDTLVFDTGGLVLDPAKQYLMAVRFHDSPTEKGAGIGASYPGEYADGYLVRQEADGYKILDDVDATFLVLPQASATPEEPPVEPPAAD